MSTNPLYEALKKCEYDPKATSTYHMMAGGLMWSDEAPLQQGGPLRFAAKLRSVIAYRASLSAGIPRPELEAEWLDLKNAVPNWPGFKEERIYGEAQRLLKIHQYKEEKFLNGGGLEKLIDDLDKEV
jgi:hypothetical protein